MAVAVEVETSLSCEWQVTEYIKLFDIINEEYTS